jgi:hypothetical protein
LGKNSVKLLLCIFNNITFCGVWICCGICLSDATYILFSICSDKSTKFLNSKFMNTLWYLLTILKLEGTRFINLLFLLLVLFLLLLRRIRGETKIYLAPRLKWKRKRFFCNYQLIASHQNVHKICF